MQFASHQREQLRQIGVTRVPGVIPINLTREVLAALANVSPVDYRDPATWGLLPVSDPGIIPSHHHQSQWEIRQHPQLHQVFSELWGTKNLWVTMDRIGFVPPLGSGALDTSVLHWDLDPRGPATFQALVYLTDAGPERAPFQAAPRVFQHLATWLDSRPAGFDFASADFSSEAIISVPGQAGDLIIWDSRLPHGPGPNRAEGPRVMQAVTMFPSERAVWTREDQIDWWRTKRPPPWWRHVPGQRDPEPGETASLTDLGQRLIGLRPWTE